MPMTQKKLFSFISSFSDHQSNIDSARRTITRKDVGSVQKVYYKDEAVPGLPNKSPFY